MQKVLAFIYKGESFSPFALSPRTWWQIALLAIALPFSLAKFSLPKIHIDRVEIVGDTKPSQYENFEKQNYYPFSKLRIWTSKIDMTFFESLSKKEFQEIIINTIPKKLHLRARALVPLAIKEAVKLKIDPLWVISIMWVESHFNPSASSHANAHGPMQILPGTAEYLFKILRRNGTPIQNEDFLLPDINIKLGSLFLKRLLGSFHNHIHATVAYNMGPGWVSKRISARKPVGMKNHYLDKVLFVYRQMVSELNRAKIEIKSSRTLIASHFLNTDIIR